VTVKAIPAREATTEADFVAAVPEIKITKPIPDGTVVTRGELVPVPLKCQLPTDLKGLFGQPHSTGEEEVVLGVAAAPEARAETDTCAIEIPKPEVVVPAEGEVPAPVKSSLESLLETSSHQGHKTRIAVIDDIAVASSAGTLALGFIGDVVRWFSSATMTSSDLGKLKSAIANSENAISVSIKSLRQISAFFTPGEQAQGTRIHECIQDVAGAYRRVQTELDDIDTLMWRAKREKDRDPDGGEITWMTFSFGSGYGIWWKLKQGRIAGWYEDVNGKRDCLVNYIAIVDREVGALRAEVQAWVAEQTRLRLAREAREAEERRQRELAAVAAAAAVPAPLVPAKKTMQRQNAIYAENPAELKKLLKGGF